MMVLQRMILCGLVGILMCFAMELSSQMPASKVYTPPPPPKPASPSTSTSSFSELKAKLRAPAQKPPRPFAPPPMEPQMHPEAFITRGDAKQIFSVIENQLNAIQHNDLQTAYYSYTSEAFKKVTPLDDFNFFVVSYPVFTSNRSSMFSSLKLNSNIAHTEGTLTSTGGDMLKVDYFFIQEDGLWKIIGIQVLPPEAQPAPPMPSIGQHERSSFESLKQSLEKKEQPFKMEHAPSSQQQQPPAQSFQQPSQQQPATLQLFPP